MEGLSHMFGFLIHNAAVTFYGNQEGERAEDSMKRRDLKTVPHNVKRNYFDVVDIRRMGSCEHTHTTGG